MNFACQIHVLLFYAAYKSNVKHENCFIEIGFKYCFYFVGLYVYIALTTPQLQSVRMYSLIVITYISE